MDTPEVAIDPQTGERIESASPSARPAIDPATGERISDTPKEVQQSPHYLQGVEDALKGFWNTVRHPIDTATAQGKQLMAGGVTPYGTPIMSPTGNQHIDEQNQEMQQGLRQEQAEQGKYLMQHPGYAAGLATPAIVLAAAGELAPKLGNVAGRAALLGKTPEEAYESALKPAPSMPAAQRASVVSTGLREGIPVSKGGYEKIGDLIDDLNNKIKGQISSDPNRPIDPNLVAERANDIVPKFTNQVNAQPDLNAIDAVKRQFLSEQGAKPAIPGRPGTPTGFTDQFGRPIMGQPTPFQPAQAAPPMRAADAQAMKQGTYQVLKGKYGEQGSAATEAQKALARGLKEEIASQFPEIGGLNAQESKLLDLQPVLERAINRISNHQMIGIGNPIVGTAVKAVTGSGGAGAVAAALKAVVDNPMVKSRLAIAVSKGAKIPYAQAISRVGSYSSALGAATSEPDGDQPNQ